MTADEVEKHLLARMNDPTEDHQRVRLDLLRLYRSMGRAADALAVATDYLAETSDTEAHAECFFHIGQTMEHVQDWESAIRWYTNALELRPRNQFYRYFCNNNLGFCLNQVGRFSDAEEYLHKAIAIDNSRANAFKNLALSLSGRGRHVEAARTYIAAIRADASDSRALGHLEELTEQNPNLYDAFPDLGHQIQKCRQAVDYAASRNKTR
jgi:tetratricopeptide (TPR) repeat protein